MTADTTRPRVVFEDPGLPHQIVIAFTGGTSHKIAVSCNCLRRSDYGTRGSCEPLEVRTRWDAADAIAVWRAHAEQAGAA